MLRYCVRLAVPDRFFLQQDQVRGRFAQENQVFRVAADRDSMLQSRDADEHAEEQG